MKRIILSLSGFLMALATLSSCSRVSSNDLKNSVPIRQDFEVVYDNATMGTSVSAVFRTKDITGARIQLTDGAALTVNNQVPNYEPLTSTYSWNSNGYQNVTFKLTKNSGESFTNTVNFGDTIGAYFPSDLGSTITKSAAFNFNALGATLAANENIVVTLVGKDKFGSYATETKGFADKAISFTRNELASFMNGPLTVQIKRQRTLNLQQSDNTGGGSRIISLQVQRSFNLTN